jgi:hypothetical protein
VRDSCRIALALSAAAALALPGCGGGEPSDLAEYFPAAAPLYSTVDLAAAREELGLPDDAEALPFQAMIDQEFELDSPEGQLMVATQLGAPQLALSVQTLQLDPVTETFDDTAITAAATAPTEDGILTAIQTDQDFDDLADGLGAEGYERDGDTLTNADAEIQEVASAGDGIVLFSDRTGVAGEAASDPPGGPAELLDLLAGADQAIAQAGTGLGDTCVVAFGGWENPQGTEGAIRIEVDGTADAERVDLDALGEGGDTLDLGEPSVDGSTIEVPFTAESDQGAFAIRALIQTTFGDVYDCD